MGLASLYGSKRTLREASSTLSSGGRSYVCYDSFAWTRVFFNSDILEHGLLYEQVVTTMT